jgi:hypothetical protein
MGTAAFIAISGTTRLRLLTIVASCVAIYTAAIMLLRVMSAENCATNIATSVAIAVNSIGIAGKHSRR